MIFPNNNLPTASKYWGREVEKYISNLDSSFKSAEINNVTRDSQLIVTASNALAAATEAQAAAAQAQAAADAANEALGLSQAQQIEIDNAQNAATDAAQAAADAALEASTANATATQAAQAAADAALEASTANGTATQAALNAAAAALEASTANGNALAALEDIVQLGSPGGPTINASNITVGTLNADLITTGALSADRISGGTIDASNISGVNISGASITGGTIFGAQAITAIGGFEGSDVNVGIVFASQQITTDGYFSGADYRQRRHSDVGATTTSSFAGNVFINTDGYMFRSTATSSREAKDNIEDYSFDTDAFISVNPVTFNYKPEAVFSPEEAELTQLGFILEDFEDAGVAEFLTIPTNDVDQYKGLRYDKLYMLLHKVVQEQNETIKNLTARIEALESR